jgi:hypothetical protein
LTKLGEQFVKLRDGGKATAWRKLQHDLMANMGLLVPAAISLKDLIAVSHEIEDFLKGADQPLGRTVEQTIRMFLETGLVDGKPLDITQ